ncbi:amidohydrolase [Vibrio sp. S4B1]|nr:amidohydrolase [Vibrio methylphosphonaticus]MCL9776291.1 amidohydrolase [Vibrio methylphosphonaticus]
MLTALFSSAVIASSVPSTDTILINANIYQHPNADSLAINNGIITRIGKTIDLEALATDDTDIIDLNQATILPGFIDNHNHVFEAASEVGGQCELPDYASLADQIPYLEACKASFNTKDWLIGYGFSLTSILENNTDTPLEVLDRIFPNQPVIIMEQTSHSMWVNSVALTLAGINQHSPDPKGGRILKQTATNKLNGILLDNAGDIVMDLAWNSLSNRFQQSYDGLLLGLEHVASNGITTIGDGRMYWKRGWYDVWQKAEDDQTLTARLSLRPWIYPSFPMAEQLAFLKQIFSDDPTRLLLVDQVKMYSDGIIINGTSKTLNPYIKTYLANDPYGINYIAPKEMQTWLTSLNDIGYSAHIHAIGDGAVQESLNAIEYVRKQGSLKPYTLTHVELVAKQDIPRFALLNVTADFQVGSEYVAFNDHNWAVPFLGQQRANAMMNPRAILDTEANVTLSSDWNVHDLNPLVGISNSLKMKHLGFETVEQAIDAYTINAAQSLGIEHITGSITIGKSADLAIIDQDITRLPTQKIPSANVIMTLLQGQVVFDIED